MQRQYAFIIDQVGLGKTVLAYDRRVNGIVHHIKDARRVALVGNTLLVDGKSAKGWTIAVKPGK